MKTLILSLAISLGSYHLFASQLAQDEKASLEGVVRRSGSNEAVAEVEIRMMSAPAGKALYALSDSNGHYLIKDIEPGRYGISVRRDGYFPPPVEPGTTVSPTSRTLTFSAAEHMKDINFQLVPGGNISGRIGGPDGKPLARLNVNAVYKVFQNGQSVLQSRGSAQTDDRGDFRIFWVPPGEYYVSAEYRPLGISAPSPRDFLAKTFFPGATDVSSAVPLTVTEGGELTANFNLISTASVRISGRVINNVPNSDKTYASFFLVSRDPAQAADRPPILANQAADRSDGKFELRGVKPGSYYLYPAVRSLEVSASPFPIYLTGRTAVEVGYKDVEGIAVVIKPNVDLKGRIISEPAKATNLAACPGGGPRVSLRPAEQLPSLVGVIGQMTQEADASGAFVIPSLPEARFRITVICLNPDGYVADLRQGAGSILNEGIIEIGSETPEPLQMTLRLDGGTLQGKVETIDGKPAAAAKILLLPQAPRRKNVLFYKRSVSNATGEFKIKGIAPGDYKVFAWPDLATGAEENPEFIAKYEDRGQVVNVKAGLATSVNVKLITDSKN